MDTQPPTVADRRAGDRRVWWVVIALFLAWPLVLVLRGAAGSEEVVPWHKSYEQARDESQSSGKAMLVYFTADWCPPCVEMSRFVFSRQQVADAIVSRYVPVKMDLTNPSPEGEAERLAEDHTVNYIPTIMVMDADGRVLARTSGYYNDEGLMAWLEAPISDR